MGVLEDRADNAAQRVGRSQKKEVRRGAIAPQLSQWRGSLPPGLGGGGSACRAVVLSGHLVVPQAFTRRVCEGVLTSTQHVMHKTLPTTLCTGHRSG